jgi:5'-nucleotidase
MIKKQILLTNDDGIRSPGLWAAAEALSQIGYVTVVAPQDQSSGMGRSLPSTSSGIIRAQTISVHDQEWTVYAVEGSPAQAVLHGILEIMPVRPDLVVSGINYGENMALGVTVSGTLGAAMEGTSLGIPSLAISLETEKHHHLSYSTEIDFSAAAHFAQTFGRALLEKRLPDPISLLKVDVPSDATQATGWEITRLSRQRYYQPTKPKRTAWSERGSVGYEMAYDLEHEPHDSDVYVMLKKRKVSVTPVTLDLTLQTDFEKLAQLIGS